MNLMFRSIEDLRINEFDVLSRIQYYQDNYYDNVYFCTEKKYIGYLNFKLDKSQKGPVNDYVISYFESIDEVKNFFSSHPNIYRVPVTKNETLIGEYYDGNKTGRDLSKKIEDKCLSLIPAFKKDIHDWSKNKTVSILGTLKTYKILKSCFSKISNSLESSDVVVDTIYSNKFRLNSASNYKTLSDILIPIFIEKIEKFFKQGKVHFHIANGILKSNLVNLNDKEAANINKSFEDVIADSDYLKKLNEGDIDSQELVKKYIAESGYLYKITTNGIHNILLDKKEPGYNIVNGNRLTVGNPDKYENTIHFFGPCVVQGVCVTDAKTIPSIVQNLLKKNNISNYRVVNHGTGYGRDFVNDLLYMMSTDFYTNDIVVWLNAFSQSELEYFYEYEIPIIDCISCFVGLHDYFYNNPFHCNYKANLLYANTIFNNIHDSICKSEYQERLNFIIDQKVKLEFDPMALINSSDMNSYMQYLKKYKKHSCHKEKIGALVLNANPCTNGHLYLISEALKIVDFLYIFLVEENKNNFQYIDREYMIKEDIKEFKNVCVLSGGNVMTSEIAFPEYFNRSDESHSSVNPILVLKIFSQKVAPCLHITFRIIGEETEDYVTKELNRITEVELQKEGIRVIIIPRKLDEFGVPISAKMVRKLFMERNYSELVKYVPKYTYKRLLELNNDWSEENFSLYSKNFKG